METVLYNLFFDIFQINGQYLYQIFQNSVLKDNKTQTIPEVYKNVKYYLSDTWYNAADADVKNIVIENLGIQI